MTLGNDHVNETHRRILSDFLRALAAVIENASCHELENEQESASGGTIHRASSLEKKEKK